MLCHHSTVISVTITHACKLKKLARTPVTNLFESKHNLAQGDGPQL